METLSHSLFVELPENELDLVSGGVSCQATAGATAGGSPASPTTWDANVDTTWDF